MKKQPHLFLILLFWWVGLLLRYLVVAVAEKCFEEPVRVLAILFQFLKFLLRQFQVLGVLVVVGFQQIGLFIHDLIPYFVINFAVLLEHALGFVPAWVFANALLLAGSICPRLAKFLFPIFV